MDNEEFSPVIDKKKKKKQSPEQFSSENAESEASIANDPQVEVNDTASAHAQIEESAKPKKKVKEKHGLKPFAFFSGIFDILVGLVIVGIGLWMCIAMLSSIDTGVTEDLDKFLGILLWPIVLVIMGVAGTAGVLLLVDGILSIVSSFKSDRKNWNGVIVAAAVFDVLLFFPTLFMAVSSGGQMQIISIVLAVVLVGTFIFKIVDINLTKRRVKKFQEAKQEEIKETYQGPNFDNLKNTNSSSAPQTLPQNNDEKGEKGEKGEKSENGTSSEAPNGQDGQNSGGGIDFSKLGK